MNPIQFALRHPIAVLVLCAAIVGGSILAVMRMTKDIFPQLNLPVIYVAQPYGGMSPKQMEGQITNYYEYHFLYITGIHHVESRNIQGVALMKLFFHPDTNMAQAMAETMAYVTRSRAFMPPGTVSPFVMRFDTGSVPVGYLVLSSETKTLDQIQNDALFKVRPMFASLPGVSAPPPFGGQQRTIVISVDPDRLRAYDVSPEEIAQAVASGQTITPAGNVRIKDKMPIVPVNSMVEDPQELGKIPIRPGSDVYLRDVLDVNKGIKIGSDIPVGYALVNGRRSVYLLVTKRADASTLSVINQVRANLPKMQDELPPDIKVSFEFDQSPYVTRAMWGVGIEALLGALLTGLMVLVFLRDWRSVIVVVLNIPLALLGALIALALTGNTINLMTLGGLALAVGILVDEATVEVENIHTQMDKSGSIARAVRLGNAETAVPRLLAMLCILAVFIPSFFMEGAARNLFVPLALAVGFSMITSYLLSSTFVPVVSVWLLRHQHGTGAAAGDKTVLGRVRAGYTRLVRRAVGFRWLLLPVYLGSAGVLWWLVNLNLGTDIFPKVDSGQFQIRFRAPTGTRFEPTEEIVVKALDIIKEKVGADNIAISLGYLGTIPSTYPINTIFLWMGGPEEAVVRVALKSGSGVRTEELKEELRDLLPKQLAAWLRPKLQSEGYSPPEIEERLRGMRFSFEPADIVNEVMSFGSPTPIEVAVSGSDFAAIQGHAAKIRAELDKIPSLRDLQTVQALDYPTIDVNVDRMLAGRSRTTIEKSARAVVPFTSSSRFTVPVYWTERGSGIGFQVQVEIPYARVKSTRDIALIPVETNNGGSVQLENIADIKQGVMPGQIDRYNMKRVISLTGNVQDEDLGAAAKQIRAAVAAAGEAPRGVRVDVRGQVTYLDQILGGLGFGLFLAFLAILLLLTAYFQSLSLALVVMSTTPAVVLGVWLMLLATGTTLNIQSFMGAIMAIGVAVANAILLVTFAERARREGNTDTAAASVDGARHRLRPILMTTC